MASLNRITLVIAGNYREYIQYIGELCDAFNVHPQYMQRMFIFADAANRLRGIRDPHFVFVGSYEMRPDWPIMQDFLATYRTFPRRPLNQVQVVKEVPIPVPTLCNRCMVVESLTDLGLPVYEDSSEWCLVMESEYGQ